MDSRAPAGTAAPSQPADPRSVRRAAWAGLIGTALEQYDFVIYGTASALVFSELFFPGVSPAAGLLASFSTYAVGFAARPLGGLFFSRLGDRLGRKWVLVTTLLLMGGSTLAIGLLPTFDQVGLLAPVLLLLCRCLQGLGAGAEQAGGATLLTETAAPGRRGRLAALVMTGAALGTAFGAVAWVLAQLLPEDQLMSWGWRLVFASSLLVTVAALILRRRLAESPVFQEIQQQEAEPRRPVAEVFRRGRRPLLLVFLMNVGASAQSYTYQVFMASYLVSSVGVDAELVPKVLLIGALCGGVAAAGFGALSDRFGRKPVYATIMGALVLLPGPSFIALSTGSTTAIVVVIVLGFILACHGGVGVQMSYFPELFGTRYRYAGVTLGREFSSVLGGGVAPLLCTALVAAFAGSWIPVAIYMSAVALISFVATLRSPETLNRNLTSADDA
ncbi:MFS transporter [Saccharopolyspora gloriosae]|uniref:MFS family permease n=1 Tax=Saccharopolyspora gloriosae TaxID=455344 RepID=A0A840NIE3_9PSEU|nr:MFS transporter [Saccharopolyspora gloriosae]MBB5068942.1 MFS family permease [Saccharopolyspora gloriosae]